MFPVTEFSRVAAAIEDGITRSLHTGVQIYISLDGKIVVDSAVGEGSPGKPITSETIMPWRSAGKPVTALMILKQIEKGRLTLASPLQQLLPETSDTDKAAVTVFDLLTHQSGFPTTETGWPNSDWETSLQAIVHQPAQVPVGTAAYHPQSSWFLLGEILRRLNPDDPEISFQKLLDKDLLAPLGMSTTFCGLSNEQVAQFAPRLPVLYERDKGQLQESLYGTIPWLTRPSPGGNLRGPIRELGRFLEVLLRHGRRTDGTAFVDESTVHQMTSRHRVGNYDQTLQHVVDYGLGVICNSNRYGIQTVPYGFGRFASDMTFGHGGSQCSIGFCDPERRLVVAWSANGFCGEGQHQRRNRLINEAIYQDLNLI